jgi:hypothetical protein
MAAIWLFCIAAWASAAVFVEDFDSSPFPPAGWILTDYANSPVSWTLDTAVSEDNQTGGTGSAAMIYSSGSPWTAYNCGLTTPLISLPAGSSDLQLRFRSVLETWSGDELAEVDISTDGSATWTNLWRHQNVDRREGIEAIPLGAYLGKDARFRFRYYNVSTQAWDLYWQIDDVRVAVPLTGDISGDGAVDVVDLLYFVDSFGLSQGDPGFDPRADFNSDQAVDVVDLLMLVENWGLVS